MKYYNFNKGDIMIAKKLFIILLISMFNLVLVISCIGSEKSTEPTINGQATEIEQPIPERTGSTGSIPQWDKNITVVWDRTDENEPEPEPELPPETFAENTYMTVYAPFSGNNYPSISYMDEETLSTTWQKMISREGIKDGKRWFIRDGDNRHNDHRYGNYYYFDKNFDIVYYKKGKGTIKVRKFRVGVITKYNSGNSAGTWTVGGLYETLLTKDEITRENSDNFNTFMRAEHMGERGKGALEVLVMNIGYTDQFFNEFGVDFYYNTQGNGYWNNIYYHQDLPPQQIDNFLNEKINLSYDLWKHNFRFVFNRAYDWHLEAHPDFGWQLFNK